MPKKYFAILAAVVPVLFYFWPSSLGGNTDFLVVYGESMLPTLQSGNLAILKDDINYKVSDIIAYHFREEGVNKVIIHRIISERPDHTFVLKGDNNISVDPEAVSPSQIIGKLLFQVPYVGYLPLIMKQPLVLIITMMALALFAMLETNKKNNENKKKAETNRHNEVEQAIKELAPSRTQLTKEVGPARAGINELQSGDKASLKKEKTTKRSRPMSFFAPALILNMIYYSVGQYSISRGIKPPDGFTNLLIFVDPYLASTIVFSSWFAAIIGSYVISRYSINVEHIKIAKTANGIVQMKRERLIPFMKFVQLFFMVFLGLYGLYTFVLISNLR